MTDFEMKMTGGDVNIVGNSDMIAWLRAKNGRLDVARSSEMAGYG
jgi:hypothetical protein